MLAYSPRLCSTSTLGWPTEDNYRQNQKSWIANDPSPFPSLVQQIEPNDSIPFSGLNNDPTLTKKLTHNASERDRRKKLNNLFASLRSILPGTDQTRKLSIPATVLRVLKYIPELQKQVERLKQRKGEILASVYNRGNIKQRNSIVRKSLPTVSVSRVDIRDILIQICTSKNTRSPFSEVLLNLEDEGLQVLDVSVNGSSGEVVFFNLHLQHSIQMVEKISNGSTGRAVSPTGDNGGIKESGRRRRKFGMRENQRLDCDLLSQKLLSMCENTEEFF